MKFFVAAAGVALTCLASSPASCQVAGGEAKYPDTEYISGKSGFDKKVKGVLVIKENEVIFQRKDGQPVFAIPMKTVTGVSSGTETDPGSFGRKMALGVFAHKRVEYLTIKTESPEQGAEAIVFNCKKKTSEGMIAKIDFFQKNAKGAPQ